MSHRPLGLAVSIIAVASACAMANDRTEPIAPVLPARAARILIVDGDAQRGVVGTELPGAITVRVVDSTGAPVAGQIVNFRVTAGNGAVYAGAAITNQQGTAADRWTLGTSVADSQRVEARAVDPATGARLVFATFNATATAGPAAAVVRQSPGSPRAGVG